MAPVYEYKAYNAQGKPARGLIESDTSKTARMKLKKQGLSVYEIGEKVAGGKTSKSGAASASGGGGFFVGRIGIKDISMMTRQLASLVKANIPLVEALTALTEQIEHPTLKVILSQVRTDVNEGASLAKALVKHPKAFDHIFVNMIEAGESSGTLSLVLVRLADLKEAQMRLRNKVVSGMTYPVLMMFVALGMLIAIFTFVIPKLTEVFQNMEKPLPMSTKFLMAVSDSLISYWYLYIAAVAFSLTTFFKFINSSAGRPKWDAFTLKVPVFGPMLRMVGVTRFASTMSTLLGSGVPILNAMTIAKNLVGNTLLAQAVASARENITEGQSIAEPLRKSGQFPPMVIHMIAIGEKTGELPDMLRNVAETYEEQVNAKIEGMTALMEPLMIVGMGAMVGFIVISILLPLMEISNIN